MGRAYTLIDTVGIEIETDHVTGGDVLNINNSLGNFFQYTHDASIEGNGYKGANTGVYFKNPPPRNLSKKEWSRFTIGTEFVSIPVDTTDKNYFKNIKTLTDVLRTLGEPERSERSSIHIHVNFAFNLRSLKAILRLGKYMEDTFYLIGCNGYTHRGEKNDLVYCRPITCPPVVSTRRGYVPIFVISDLLESETTKEFWWKLGNISQDNPLQRYHPSRYTWLNLYSLLYHGTLEFRSFNKTLNPEFIRAEIDLCKKFSIFCLEQSFSSMKDLGLLQMNSAFKGRSKEEIISSFGEISKILNLEKETEDVLMDIMKASPLPKFKPGWVYSHLQGNYFDDASYSPERIPSGEIRRPEYVDIHILRGERH